MFIRNVTLPQLKAAALSSLHAWQSARSTLAAGKPEDAAKLFEQALMEMRSKGRIIAGAVLGTLVLAAVRSRGADLSSITRQLEAAMDAVAHELARLSNGKLRATTHMGEIANDLARVLGRSGITSHSIFLPVEPDAVARAAPQPDGSSLPFERALAGYRDELARLISQLDAGSPTALRAVGAVAAAIDRRLPAGQAAIIASGFSAWAVAVSLLLPQPTDSQRIGIVDFCKAFEGWVSRSLPSGKPPADVNMLSRTLFNLAACRASRRARRLLDEYGVMELVQADPPPDLPIAAAVIEGSWQKSKAAWEEHAARPGPRALSEFHASLAQLQGVLLPSPALVDLVRALGALAAELEPRPGVADVHARAMISSFMARALEALTTATEDRAAGERSARAIATEIKTIKSNKEILVLEASANGVALPTAALLQETANDIRSAGNAAAEGDMSLAAKLLESVYAALSFVSEHVPDIDLLEQALKQLFIQAEQPGPQGAAGTTAAATAAGAPQLTLGEPAGAFESLARAAELFGAAPAAGLAIARDVLTAIEAQKVRQRAVASSQVQTVDAVVDRELFDIFKAEADEILNDIQSIAMVAIGLGQFTTAQSSEIRRHFHTLKGSARMVGLSHLGEMAWQVERRMNEQLAGGFLSPGMAPASLEVARRIMQAIHAIEADGAASIDVEWAARALSGSVEVEQPAPPPASAPSDLDAEETDSEFAVTRPFTTEEIAQLTGAWRRDAVQLSVQDVVQVPSVRTDHPATREGLSFTAHPDPVTLTDVIPSAGSAERPFSAALVIDGAGAGAGTGPAVDPSDETVAIREHSSLPPAPSTPNDAAAADAVEPVQGLESAGPVRALAVQDESPVEPVPDHPSPTALAAAASASEASAIEFDSQSQEPIDAAQALEPTVMARASANKVFARFFPAAASPQTPVDPSASAVDDQGRTKAAATYEPADGHGDAVESTEVDPPANHHPLEPAIAADADSAPDEASPTEPGLEKEAQPNVTTDFVENPETEPAVSAISDPAQPAPGHSSYVSAAVDPEIMASFDAESRQLAQILQAEFDRVAEHGISAELIRSAHGLAGLARLVAFPELQRAARAVEDWGDAARQQPSLRAAPALEAASGVVTALLRVLHAHQERLAGESISEALIGRLHDLCVSTQSILHPKPEPTTQSDDPAASGHEATGNPFIDHAAGVRDDLDPDLLDIFRLEAEELLTELDSELLTLRSGGNFKQVNRLLHTLKGGARMAGLLSVGASLHKMEDATLSPEPIDLESASGQRLVIDLQRALDFVRARLFEFFHPQDRTQDRKNLTRSDEEGSAPLAPADPGPGPAREPMQPLASPQVRDQPGQPGAGMPGPGVGPAGTGAAQAESSGEVSSFMRVKTASIDVLLAMLGRVRITQDRIRRQTRAGLAAAEEAVGPLARLRRLTSEISIEAEKQIDAGGHAFAATVADRPSNLPSEQDANTAGGGGGEGRFDALEMDRFSKMHELTRRLAEASADLEELFTRASQSMNAVSEAVESQQDIADEMDSTLATVSRSPLAAFQGRLRAAGRQAMADTGKLAALKVEGDVLIDRSVMEPLIPAIEHLVRNSIAHGIESTTARTAAGKPPEGLVTINASNEGRYASIAIADDGAGIDFGRIRQVAVERGLLPESAQPSEDELTSIMFSPGFSTAKSVTQTAGRGVGLDVVVETIQRMGGRVSLQTQAGKGSTFTIRVPLSSSHVSGLLMTVAGKPYIVPSSLVRRASTISADSLKEALDKAGPLAVDADTLVSPVKLGDICGVPGQARATGLVTVVVPYGSQHGIFADEVEYLDNAPVRPFSSGVPSNSGILGHSVLSDGRVAVVVSLRDVIARREERLAEEERLRREAAASQGLGQPQAVIDDSDAQPSRVRVMVVDDSVTVRAVSSKFLARHGYDVMTANNGREALDRLADAAELPDVILLDIEMPVMDGFETCSFLKESARLRHIPVAIVSSRNADKHRDHAIDMGAAAFFGKPYKEADILSFIRQSTGQDDFNLEVRASSFGALAA